MFGITRQGSISSETLTVVKATFLIVFVSHHPPNRNSLVPYSCLFFFKCKEQRTFLSWEFINQTSYRYILNIFLSVLVSSSQLSKLHLQRPSLSNSDLEKKKNKMKETHHHKQPDLGASLCLSPNTAFNSSRNAELPVFWHSLKLHTLLPKCGVFKKGNGAEEMSMNCVSEVQAVKNRWLLR